MVGRPLLSNIDVRLPGFLPRGLIVGEAQEREPCFIREGSLLPVKDGSVDIVFRGRAEHLPIEDPTIGAI